MKILFAINSLGFGGAEKLLVDSIPLYISKGIKIDLLILDGQKNPFYEKLHVLKGVNIYLLKSYSSIYNPFFIFKIQKFLRNYDLIHSHLFPTFYWVALSNLIFNNRTPLILTEHNTQNRRRKISIFKLIDPLIYKRYSKVITISESARINLLNHLGQNFESKLITINNGIDLKKIVSAKPYDKESLNLPRESKLIIQVASFTEQKDQNSLIRALACLSDNVHLFLVGDGPKINESKNLVRSLSIDNRVHFLGYRDDVPRLLKTVDICVLSTFYEGLPLSIVEGMAAGNICIGSDVEGLSDVVGGAGLLFEKGNHSQLASIINDLLTNEVKGKAITKKCFERSKFYDINFMVDKYLKVYSEFQK